MFKCSCHSMKCDKGADAWNKFEDTAHQCFPYQCWATCAANMGCAKVFGESKFLARMSVSAWKNLEQPFTRIRIIYVFLRHGHPPQMIDRFDRFRTSDGTETDGLRAAVEHCSHSDLATSEILKRLRARLTGSICEAQSWRSRARSKRRKIPHMHGLPRKVHIGILQRHESVSDTLATCLGSGRPWVARCCEFMAFNDFSIPECAAATVEAFPKTRVQRVQAQVLSGDTWRREFTKGMQLELRTQTDETVVSFRDLAQRWCSMSRIA